ncbi:DNA internalization-related competence protein ComEC/Rec2 [Pseudoxanthomonas sp. GM95]|uniref:DNA internalization-related competence protein ComEC/Rec2 n=1 Tax=Pseudoxanthomonas sp. GM95 TaxID=1881043 RepID=UPI000B876233|nr:DNA internalization-related competence protein ComEC/Rec2 [Pseudoxanthomonas sp. GM95]
MLAGSRGGLLLPALPARWVLVVLLCLGIGLWWRPGGLRLLAALLVGLAWTGLQAGHVLSAQLPPRFEKQDLVLEGRIVGLPQAEARRTRFDFLADACPGEQARGCGRRLQLSWYDDFGATAPGPRTQLHAGARWKLVVRLRAPRGLANPGGFDSERYALARRVAATGYVRQVERARALSPPTGVDAWRERMSARIASQAPPASQRFVRALALGDTGSLDDADWNTLRAAGLTHLIAISGFHVGLVAGLGALLVAGLWRLFPQLGRWWPRSMAAGVAAMGFATGYAVLSGFSLPTTRTVLMIAVVALARCGRRPASGVQSLALATLAVLLVDPLSPLVAGFWLSFAGVGWLLWCLPRSDAPLLRQFLSAQGVASLGLLPLTVVLFGQASLAGPLANLVAIPWWSLVIVPLSLLGTGLEALHAGWGTPAWWLAGHAFEPSWALFAWMARSRFSLWWLAEGAWYTLPLALLGAFWLLLPRGVPGKPLALLLWLPLMWPDTGRPAPGEVALTVLDVGQGLSVLVRTHDHALLFDTGPAVADGFDAGERVVVPALHALGIDALDRVMVSHGDADHAGGLGAVLLGMPVREVLAPSGSPVPLQTACRRGQAWEWDGVSFEVLHPARGFPYLGNEASCVLRVQARQGAALLTGDIGQVIERKLLREQPTRLRAEVVLAPHHGSDESSDPGFVQATGARLALVSAGYGNRFGHPRAQIVRRWQQAGSEVLNTADSGALTVWLGADGLAVRERRAWQRRLWDAVGVRSSAALSYRSVTTRPQAPED